MTTDLEQHARQIAELISPSVPVEVRTKTETTVIKEHRIQLPPAHIREYLALKGMLLPDEAQFQVENWRDEFDVYHLDDHFPIIVTWAVTEKRATE